MDNGYIYQTSDASIVIVVPTLADFDPYAAETPSYLSAASFNLTSPATSTTLRLMRSAASAAGVRLHQPGKCAYVHNIERIPALEP